MMINFRVHVKEFENCTYICGCITVSDLNEDWIRISVPTIDVFGADGDVRSCLTTSMEFLLSLNVGL